MVIIIEAILLILLLGFIIAFIGPILTVVVVVGVIALLLYIIYWIYKTVSETTEYASAEKKKYQRKRIEDEFERRIGLYRGDIVLIDNALKQYIYTNKVAKLLNLCIKGEGCSELKIYLNNELLLHDGIPVGGMDINALERRRNECQKEVTRLEREKISIMSSMSGYNLESVYNEFFAEEDEAKRKMERQVFTRKLLKRMLIGTAAIVVVASLIWACDLGRKEFSYSKADKLYKGENYEKAYEIYENLGDYKESAVKMAALNPLIYEQAEKKVNEDNTLAALMFGKLASRDYKDAYTKSMECWKKVYKHKELVIGDTIAINIVDGKLCYAPMDWGDRDTNNWSSLIAIDLGGDALYGDTIGNEKIGLTNEGYVLTTGFKDGYGLTIFSGIYYGDYGKSWNGIVNIAGGETFLAGLRYDGTVCIDGKEQSESFMSTVNDWKNIIDIQATDDDLYALDVLGKLHSAKGEWSWGSVSPVTLDLMEDIDTFSVFERTIIGITKSGQVRSSIKEAEDWVGIKEVSAGYGYVLGLKTDGTVIAAGNNEYGQCDVDEWTDIVHVYAGKQHSIAKRKDGEFVAIGYNKFNQCDVSSLNS